MTDSKGDPQSAQELLCSVFALPSAAEGGKYWQNVHMSRRKINTVLLRTKYICISMYQL